MITPPHKFQCASTAESCQADEEKQTTVELPCHGCGADCVEDDCAAPVWLCGDCIEKLERQNDGEGK